MLAERPASLWVTNADDVTWEATAERKGFGKRLAIDERAEILAGGHGPGVLVQVKVAPATEDDVLAALVEVVGGQSPVPERR